MKNSEDVQAKKSKSTVPIWALTGLALLLAVLIVSVVLLASVPPVSRDALTQHLAVPKIYLERGGMDEIVLLISSYNPQNIDLLYLIPLIFEKDIWAKYIHFSLGLLTAVLIFSYLKNRLGKNYALMGVILFLSVPIVVKLSITVYVDLGLAFFSTASLLLLIKWKDKQFDPKYLFLSAVCCGLAMGTKYSGLILFFLLNLTVPIIYLRFSRSVKPSQYKAIGYTLVFGIVSVAVFSPWMIKNFVQTGNPLYPLFYNLFGPKIDAHTTWRALVYKESVEYLMKSMNLFSYRSIMFGEPFWKIVTVPVRIFFQGEDGNPRLFDGRLNPFLLVLPILAFFRFKTQDNNQKSENLLLFLFSFLFILFSFFSTRMRIRYITPIIPFLVILSVFGYYRICSFLDLHGGKIKKSAAHFICAGLFFVILIPNAVYIANQFKIVRPIEYIRGEISRDAYIERYRPEYPVIRYANRNLNPDDRILGLFLGRRVYYSEREIFNGLQFFRRKTEKSNSPMEIFQASKQLGITHIIVNSSLFNNWISADFTPEKLEMIKLFFDKHTQMLFSENQYALFVLK